MTEAQTGMEQLLLDLLYRLEAIGDRDESLYDTVVREKMGDAVFFGFVKPKPEFVLPDDYGIPDAENRAIKAALQAYVEGARALAPGAGLDTFHKRLAASRTLPSGRPSKRMTTTTSSDGPTRRYSTRAAMSSGTIEVLRPKRVSRSRERFHWCGERLFRFSERETMNQRAMQ